MSTYKGYTEVQKRANAKYDAKFVRPTFRMTEELHKAMTAHAEACGESVSSFLNRAIAETMERDRERDT